MRRFVLAPLAIVVASTQAAEVSRFTPEKSAVAFVSKQMDVPVDPARPESGRPQIAIDMTSADTASSDADDESGARNWFKAAQYPKASFVSTVVSSLGGAKYDAAGKLTIKGITRRVKAPSTVVEGPWSDTGTVADDAQIRFKLYAKP